MNHPRPVFRSLPSRQARSLLTAVATTVFVSAGLAGCSGTPERPYRTAKAEVDPRLGVAPSPRVIRPGDPVPKGGGVAMVGKPYKVGGKRYVPRIDPDYARSGLASWYGSAFHGRRTANGEIFDADSLSAAHPTMPLPSYARVTSLTTGRSVMVRVNDRGPFHSNRIMDISRRTADMLGVRQAGIAKVKVEYVGPAPTDGDDTRFLMASYRGPADAAPSSPGIGETLVASARSLIPSLPGVGSGAGEAPEAKAPARTLVASAEPARRAPAPAAEYRTASGDDEKPVVAAVLPRARPVAMETYVVVASVDPAAVTFAAPVQLASVAPAALPVVKAAYQPSAQPVGFEVGPQPIGFQGVAPADTGADAAATIMAPTPPAAPEPGLLPRPTPRSSYAEDRITGAYAAVDGMEAGVGLADLTRSLESLSQRDAAPAARDLSLQVGTFGDPANAARMIEALSGIGTLDVEPVTVGGRTLQRVRLSDLAPGVTAEDAIAAAERAGAKGVQVLR